MVGQFSMPIDRKSTIGSFSWLFPPSEVWFVADAIWLPETLLTIVLKIIQVDPSRQLIL